MGSVESPDAILSPAAKVSVHNLLEDNEEVRFAAQPNRWRANASPLIISTGGTIGFLVALILIAAQKASLNWLYLLPFPLALILTLSSVYRYDRRYVVITNSRLLGRMDRTFQVDLGDVLSVTEATNYLFCNKELKVYCLPSTNYSPTSISRQSPRKEVALLGLTAGDHVQIQEILEAEIRHRSDGSA